MDFRGLDGYVLTHEEDAVTGDLTVTIKNPEETAVIGTIIIEPQKLQVLADSLSEFSKSYLRFRTDTPYRRRTVNLKNEGRVTTEFFT